MGPAYLRAGGAHREANPADMRLPRIDEHLAAGQRGGWLSGAAVKFAVLCAAVAGIAMLSPRLSRTQAGVTALVGAVGILVGALALVMATRRLADRRSHQSSIPIERYMAGSFLALIRTTGVALLGLAFFAIWSFVYLAMWWFDPGHAFTGLSTTPRYSDFFYYSVSTGLISPPGDIIASSRGARAATIIEMLAGLALVTTYLSSFAVSETTARGNDGPSPRSESGP